MRPRLRRRSPPPGTASDTHTGHVELPTAAAPAPADSRPVLVAVSGTQDWAALEWSAAEAAARQSPLRIVHTFPLPPGLDGTGNVPAGPALHAGQQAARRVLDQATCRAQAIAPDLPITAYLQPGPTVPGLVRERGDDSMVVVGRPGTTRGWPWPSARSTSRRLTRHSSTPVIVVGLSPATSTPGPSAGSVVVGLDLEHPVGPVLDFAFAAASRRHVGVTVVHSWAPSTRDRRYPDREATAWALREQRLSDALEPHQSAFDDVPVRRHLTTEPAPSALANESVGAALLVVGIRPSAVSFLPLRGKVADLVVRNVRVPVGVVPLTAPTRSQPVPDQGTTPAR